MSRVKPAWVPPRGSQDPLYHRSQTALRGPDHSLRDLRAGATEAPLPLGLRLVCVAQGPLTNKEQKQQNSRFFQRQETLQSPGAAEEEPKHRGLSDGAAARRSPGRPQPRSSPSRRLAAVPAAAAAPWAPASGPGARLLPAIASSPVRLSGLGQAEDALTGSPPWASLRKNSGPWNGAGTGSGSGRPASHPEGLSASVSLRTVRELGLRPL